MPVRTEPNPSRGSRSLVTTLAIAFVLLSVTPLLLISGLLSYFGFQIQREAVFYQQQLTAAEAATKVSGFIEQIFSKLETSAQVGQVSNQEEQQLILEKLLGLEDALRELILVDKTGQAIAAASRRSSASSSNLLKLVENDGLAQVSQAPRFISAVSIDEETSEPLVRLAVPLKDVFGEFQGALLAEVNLKFMWDLVDRLKVGETGTAFVVDKQGNLIAFGDASRVLKGENLSQLTEVAEFINGSNENEAALYYTGIDGSAVAAAYVPLGTPDWAVVTEIPVAEAYQRPLYNGAILLGTILVVAALAAGSGIYASRYLTRPLLNLTQTATRLAAGETGLQAAPEGPAEVERLAAAFNTMTAQLQELIGSLEERVEARTRRLETIATMSERLTAILDFEHLLQELVDELKAEFAYYHAHVYIIDDRGQNLALAAGVGEAGAQMRARGHAISLNAPTSLVARAARTREIVRVDNVREAADWLPNPLLPETYSEMAVPIISEGKVMGVLDVQQDEVAGLDEGDANLLRSLAHQVAVAIRNARLFAQVETALAEARATQAHYLQQVWQKAKITSPRSQYLYAQANAAPLDEATQQALAQVRQQLVAQAQPLPDREASPKTLVAPVKLQNKTIGAVQLYSGGTDQSWSEDDRAIIAAVSEQLAQSAENLRLFDETQERAGREQTIRVITDKLRAAPNINAMLEIAARELGSRLGAQHTRFELGMVSPEAAHEDKIR